MSGPLLEELINNISTLASVYHKPPETFLGRGRFGADAVQRRAIEYVYLFHFIFYLISFECLTKFIFPLSCREQEEASRESPIQAQVKTNIENLLDLDFNDNSATPTSNTPPSSSKSTNATANVDDLLDLFGGSNMNNDLSTPPQSSSSNNHQNNGLTNDLVSLF